MNITDNKKFLLIIGGCLAIAIIIIIFTLFGNKSNNDKYIDLALKAYQEKADMAIESRKILEVQVQDYKNEISEHKKLDSLLVEKINSNNKSVKQIDDRIKNIPAHIASLGDDNDKLRRAIAELE